MSSFRLPSGHDTLNSYTAYMLCWNKPMLWSRKSCGWGGVLVQSLFSITELCCPTVCMCVPEHGSVPFTAQRLVNPLLCFFKQHFNKPDWQNSLKELIHEGSWRHDVTYYEFATCMSFLHKCMSAYVPITIWHLGLKSLQSCSGKGSLVLPLTQVKLPSLVLKWSIW